jgi:hypothetical protein
MLNRDSINLTLVRSWRLFDEATRSWTCPPSQFLIISVILFGLIGAMIGYIAPGKAISMFSLFGLIALAGVVVNAG